MTQAEKTDRRTAGTSVLGIAIAIGVVLLIVVGLFAMKMARSDQMWMAFVRSSPQFAADWVEDVRAGRLDAAYRATSAAYRARVDREAFGRWVADHPELKLAPEPRGWTMSARSTGFTIGLNGIGIWDPPPKLTHRTAFRPAGEAPGVLSVVVTTDPDGLHIDRADAERETGGPSPP